MSIRQLSLTDFRNLQSSTLDFHPSLNLICGANGSGKTSLLEAIYILCQARSFRQRQLKKCIQHEKSSFLLFGRFDHYKAGLSKSEKKLQIRINGEAVKRRSELVSKIPINIVNANSFELITGPPDQRRQYIDWCLFHVKQSYTENWVQFRHALRQRNKLLKSRQDLKMLDYWDEYIIKPSINLKEMRIEYSEKVNEVLNHEFCDLLSDIKISLEYQQGWSGSKSLKECLRISRDKDIRSGFTNIGIHRDNLVILSDGKPAAEVLSRGQIKRLSMALLVAGLKLVSDQFQSRIILLIDDLRAEMDKESQEKIYRMLFNIDLQLFVTNIDSSLTNGLKGKDFKMFHVEHGMIKAPKFS